VLSPYEFIAEKQRGNSHKPSEIHDFIQGFIEGEVHDYQMTAWMMSVFFQGMSYEETIALTKAMIQSGNRVDLSNINDPTGDKHSTGGVGDKITLILAPLLSASGMVIPTIAGRGLGFTGGTLDKLESIPGLSTALSIDEIKDLSFRNGLAFGAQTDDLVPADRRMYALRDVTSTVRSLPLITASILSKKVAEGIGSIVFDVKCGKGAFMETEPEAIELGQWLVNCAERFELKAAALITTMDEPIGRTVGNWLETEESIDVLRRKYMPPDIVELTESLGGTLLMLAGITGNIEQGINRLREAWNNGSAFDKFSQAVNAQGGDTGVFEENHGIYDQPRIVIPLTASKSGYISEIHAREVGYCGVLIGAGRKKTDDVIDPTSGFIFKKKVGDFVQQGEEILLIMGNDESQCKTVHNRLSGGVTIMKKEPAKTPLIRKVITREGNFEWLDYRNSK